jgi:chromate transporter
MMTAAEDSVKAVTTDSPWAVFLVFLRLGLTPSEARLHI